MTEESFDYQAHPHGVQFHGPFREPYRVTVAKYRVPHLEAYPSGQGGWFIILDERFGIDAGDAEARKWLRFIAQCMAVAAGYSSHGAHSGRDNPYHHRLLSISSTEAGGALPPPWSFDSDEPPPLE